MNVKDLVTEDASHLNLNGSLCKQMHTLSLFPSFLWRPWVTRVNNMRDLCEDQQAEVVWTALTSRQHVDRQDLQMLLFHSTICTKLISRDQSSTWKSFQTYTTWKIKTSITTNLTDIWEIKENTHNYAVSVKLTIKKAFWFIRGLFIVELSKNSFLNKASATFEY